MYEFCNNVSGINNMDSSPLISLSTSDCDNSLADVFSLQYPHESSWHLFKAFCDVLPTLQFALQMQNKQINKSQNDTEADTWATLLIEITSLLKTHTQKKKKI